MMIIIVKGSRQWKGFMVKHPQIHCIRHPGSVGSFVTDNQAERLTIIPFVKPFLSHILYYIRNIPLISLRASIHGDKVGIEIAALTGKDLPIIKSLRLIA